MPLVELFAKRGSLPERRHRQISEALVAEVMRAEGAPDTEAARSISWLLFHEVDTWMVGGREAQATEPPRFVVRVGVPAGSLNEEKRADLVARVTRVLAEADDDPERLYRRPDAWVHINEIPDGNWGALGHVVRLADIASFVTAASPPGVHTEVQR